MKKLSVILALSMSMCLLSSCGTESEMTSGKTSLDKTPSDKITTSEAASSETTSAVTSSAGKSSGGTSSAESSSVESKSSKSSQNVAESSCSLSLYADFGSDDVKKYTYDYNGGGESPEDYAAALSGLTGLDFVITAAWHGTDLYVDWNSKSTLISGLDDREQKQEFFFYDHDSLSWFMMDSLWQTLQMNFDINNIYYTMDGGKELTPMDLSPISSIPADSPYATSNYYKYSNTPENEQAADNYLGTWGCGRATLNISVNEDGAYQAKISWADSAFAHTEWVYILYFDTMSKEMVCNNNAVRTYYEYKDGNSEPEITVMYTDGSGSFFLSDGVITWYDAEENCGEGMEFVK